MVSTLVVSTVLAIPGLAGAQVATPIETPAKTPELTAHEGSRPHPSRLYLGMWTTHLKNRAIVLDNNWVIGMTARGFFGASFLNSYGKRAFAGGIQRDIISADPTPIGASFGYRLGFITGYDGRLMRLARKTPVLPLVQPYVSVDAMHVGVEVSYTFVVISAAVSYRF